MTESEVALDIYHQIKEINWDEQDQYAACVLESIRKELMVHKMVFKMNDSGEIDLLATYDDLVNLEEVDETVVEQFKKLGMYLDADGNDFLASIELEANNDMLQACED